MSRKWTTDEIKTLIEMRLSGKSYKDCARVLNRSKDVVREQLLALNLVFTPNFTSWEKAYIQQHLDMTDGELATRLGRSPSAIKNYRQKSKS